MEPEKHILNDDDLDTPLHEVLEKCKADGMPIHIASEEHGEYVVVKKDELEHANLKINMAETIHAIEQSEMAYEAGEVISLDEAFSELRRRHEL